MRIFTLLLVVTVILLLSGSAFAFAVADADIAIAVQNGAAAEMTATLLDSGDSEAVAATRMMASGADMREVAQGLDAYREHRNNGQGHVNHGNGNGYGHLNHGNGHGYGHGNCVSPG